MKFKKVFIVLIIFFLAKNSFCQNADEILVDSLVKLFSATKIDTQKVNILNAISKELWRTGNFKEAMNNANQALVLGKKAGFKKGIANSYNNIGATYMKMTNFEEGLKNYTMALNIRKEMNDLPAISSSYINIGNEYLEQDNYPEALKSYLAALKIGEEIRDTGIITNSYNSMGNVYNQQGNYPEALRNYFIGLKMTSSINSNSLSMSYVNIGDVYTKLGNYEDALKSFNSALEMQRTKKGDVQIISCCYSGIGNVYLREGMYMQSLRNYQSALEIQKKNEFKYDVPDSYINIGKVYIKLNDHEKAKEYLTEGLLLAKDNRSKIEIKDAYGGLSELDSISGNIRGAFQYYLLYSAMKDSLVNEETNKQLSKLSLQYENEKKEKEIILLNKNNEIKTIKIERQNATVRYLVGGFSLLILFAVVAFWLYNQKRKVAFKHEILDTKMTALRSQMNPHFTFNVLNSIQYYAGENDVKSVQHYLRQFSRLIRMVLDQSRTSYITLEQEITMLKLYLELEEMRFEEKFKYSIESKLNEADSKKILIPGMLIQPLVENAIKHGIEHKEGEALINVFFYLQNSTLVCQVKDNGIGRARAMRLKADEEIHVSAATTIIKERMEALSSIYNIRLECKTEDLFGSDGSSEGTCVTMEIPIIKNRENSLM